MKDYYKILGVPNTATQEEIKNAYRSLVKKYHPDINPDVNAVSMMQDINEAYEVLSNLASRQKYDALLQQQSKSTVQTSQCTKQHAPYSSYTKTREESENDFDEWLKEYLKILRKIYKSNPNNYDFIEKAKKDEFIISRYVANMNYNIPNYNINNKSEFYEIENLKNNIIKKHLKYR